ncbi:uncharacterized protein LOC107466039 [Arachis duranensis]|uniref:Uncharacterized protein LOC107466039 n=1 Tax=Arachis duranensis TaxID=130453 RepID=A0A6P4C237_ARADU|nr:uncharacterized protein LOC107466039 [Arachis duranensis]
MGKPAGNDNENKNGNGEGDGNDLGGAPMTLASFLKVHPSTFRGSLSVANCGRFHPYDLCKLGIGGCFTCGLSGHLAKDCPRGRNLNAGRNQHQGRVFAVNTNDADKGDPLMRGISLIGDKILVALYDTGASHSFNTFDKVEELGLKILELAFDLHVHTPYQAIVTKLGCRHIFQA